jgi:hypothetical protein
MSTVPPDPKGRSARTRRPFREVTMAFGHNLALAVDPLA